MGGGLRHAGVSDDAAARPELVAELARHITEVYRDADDDLRHAVHDSLLAGTPDCVLAGDLEDTGVDLLTPERQPPAPPPAPGRSP